MIRTIGTVAPMRGAEVEPRLLHSIIIGAADSGDICTGRLSNPPSNGGSHSARYSSVKQVEVNGISGASRTLHHESTRLQASPLF